MAIYVATKYVEKEEERRGQTRMEKMGRKEKEKKEGTRGEKKKSYCQM
jgi:hypothetical protein